MSTRKRRRRTASMNLWVSGLVHLVDPIQNLSDRDPRMSYCWVFLDATTRLVRQPVTCVQCLAGQAVGSDPWDARTKLGDRTGSL